jgi:hypothetical protein
VTWQADMDVIYGNPKLAGIDLEKILTPASELRPGAAQRCIMAQVHSLVLTSFLCRLHIISPSHALPLIVAFWLEVQVVSRISLQAAVHTTVCPKLGSLIGMHSSDACACHKGR